MVSEFLIAATYTLKNEKGSSITFSLKPTRHLNDYDLEFKSIKKDEDFFDNDRYIKK